MQVLLVEPYYGGSHAQWADGYKGASRHDVTLVTHDARFWKWRLEGGPVTLAADAAAAVAGRGRPDVILASSMVNLPAFLGLARRSIGDTPVVLYMHENQLTYPASHLSQEDLTHAIINWTSTVAADEVWFNSAFHLDDFFGSIEELLGRFPDYRHLGQVDAVRARSAVKPVGVDVSSIRAVAAERSAPPLILWNQRWEHDKNPEEFFSAIDALVAAGTEFRLALAGEVFSSIPGTFDAAKDRLGERIVHFGYAERDDYLRLLRAADIVVSTSHHEFFGVAVVEAMAAGAHPVLPNRLAYPGHIPPQHHDAVLYDDFDGLVSRLQSAVSRQRLDLAAAMARYDWGEVAPAYDSGIESLVM